MSSHLQAMRTLTRLLPPRGTHADDLGWANVGWHDVGQSLITSGPGQPHMKKLVAEESITLDRHYAYPYCSPTRASTLTGRLPYHVNQINIGSYLPGAGVARNMTMIPVQSAAIAPD